MECQDCGLSHKAKDFRCTRLLDSLDFIFIRWILIWEHPDPGMSFKSLNFYSKMVLKSLFSIVIDLEMPKDRCMCPMRSRTCKWSNPRFPTKTRYNPRFVTYYLLYADFS